MQPQPILHFWFTKLPPQQHSVKAPVLDDAIRNRFGASLRLWGQVLQSNVRHSQ